MTALETLLGEFTLHDLATRSGKTIKEIVTFAMKEKEEKLVALAPVVSVQKNTVNTRTPAGRTAYDETILQHLQANKGTWMGANEIRKSVGGSALQVRTCLNRLIAEHGIQYQGKARATQYQI